MVAVPAPPADVRGERRHHPRVEVSLHVELETADGVWVEGRSINLSAGGIKLRASRPLTVGDLVYLVLGRDDRIVAAVGDVLATSALPDTGLVDMRVRFRDLSERRRRGLERIVAEAGGT